MASESAGALNSDVNSFNITSADEVKILNTDARKLNITNIVEENKKNELKSPSIVADHQRKSSLSHSLDSNNVSIVTLDENGDDSSIIDSEEDCEDVLSPSELRATATSTGIVLANDGSSNAPGAIHSQEHDAPKLNIGSIAVQNSSGITFGNKTFYQGPVTIKQFLYDNNKWKPTDQGTDNAAFASGSITNLDRQPNNETGKVVKYRLHRKPQINRQ